MNVYIGKPVVISDMQGPCDSGFHVPTADERETLYNVGQTLGIWSSSNGTNIEKYLKMPLAGRRTAAYGYVNNQGSAGYYWSCIAYYNSGLGEYYGYDMAFGNTYVYYKDTNYGVKATGMSIRPFKDTPVIPDSNRTVVYQGTGTAGIYYNSTLGLISLSSNGTTWITIADKNLGATTVYNYGDTLAESNCGKYYQRGNNYGFAWTGNLTTSTTRVNASTYGPGNYYSSSTFISGNNDRSSVQNNNLRGGVSQGSGTKSVELKNAYIGEYIPALEYDFTTGTHGWTPSSSAGLQNSNGLYANGLTTDVRWSAPSAIYNLVPKKIIINYNKTGTDNGTGLYTASPDAWYFLPRGMKYQSLQNRFDWKANGTITQNTISNPTGRCTWELDIDTSTTNWTVTHKITGVNDIVESSGAFKDIWNSGTLQLRTINWNSGNPGIYIEKIIFEY